MRTVPVAPTSTRDASQQRSATRDIAKAGACTNSAVKDPSLTPRAQTEACAWSVEYILRRSDVVQRGTFIGLALMLAYTFFVLIRFLRCCLLARFESRKVQLEAPDLQARKRKLVGDLTRGLGILKAIGSAAPFLGLVGTSYGILAEFSGWAMSRGSAVSYLLRATPSALLTAGAGILVAVPAVVIHN